MDPPPLASQTIALFPSSCLLDSWVSGLRISGIWLEVVDSYISAAVSSYAVGPPSLGRISS